MDTGVVPANVLAAFKRIRFARAWARETRVAAILALECYCPRTRNPLSEVACAAPCEACWQGARAARAALDRGCCEHPTANDFALIKAANQEMRAWIQSVGR
jgi:hypothetical protein